MRFPFLTSRRGEDPRERRDSLENPSVDLVTALVAESDGTSITGATLTPAKALRMTAVYAAVRVIAESCASLPLPVYTGLGGERHRVDDDGRGLLLNVMPNPEQTAMELLETWFAHALLWGRGYLYVVYDNAGRPIELWPLRPDRTQEKRTPDGEPYFLTELANGQPQVLAAENVVVQRSILGLSPIKTARQSLASAFAAEEYGGRFWSNNARPGGVIQIDGPMDNAKFEEFRRRWRAGHEGLKRSQLVGILTDGATWKDVGIAPGLAQFIETRQFGVREVARLFRVPPHMIADLEGTVTRASIEQQSIEFVVYTLRPWLVRAEQALRHRLFSTRADVAANTYPEFLVEGLMRGDIKSRYEAYGVGIQWGFLCREDVRQMEGLPNAPGQGLEQFLIPMNMLPSGTSLPLSAGGEDQGAASALTWLALLTRARASGNPQVADAIERELGRLGGGGEPRQLDVHAGDVTVTLPPLTIAQPEAPPAPDVHVEVEAPSVTVNVPDEPRRRSVRFVRDEDGRLSGAELEDVPEPDEPDAEPDA